MTASISISSKSSNVSNDFIAPKYKATVINALISAVAILAFLVLATAVASLVVFSGFMFSIGVIPDGFYLLIGAAVIGVFAGYVGYKAYQRCLMTHNCLHHPEKVKGKV